MDNLRREGLNIYLSGHIVRRLQKGGRRSRDHFYSRYRSRVCALVCFVTWRSYDDALEMAHYFPREVLMNPLNMGSGRTILLAWIYGRVHTYITGFIN